MQDGFRGGMVAASWLVSRGRRRIAFLGPPVAGARPQIVERYSGALGALARAGLELPETVRLAGDAEAEARAAELLSRPDRPTGVLALWRGIAVGTVRAARRLGLVIGQDLDIVGWSTAESYETGFRQVLSGGEVPPAVVWSVRELAETAVARLEQRRKNPGLPTIHLRIPVRLKFAKGDES
jgi:DNA-binding LacI/PurR family transcriptional regulator